MVAERHWTRDYAAKLTPDRQGNVRSRALKRDAVRSIDRRAIEEYGLPGVVLMENAGRGAAELLIGLGISGQVVICAGKGNNGGDGFVIARHLECAGCTALVLLFADPTELTGDAAINWHVLEAAGTPLRVMGAEPDVRTLREALASADWIVDALLGTGARSPLREPFLTAIRAINAADARVLAVDLPSGMDCDTGRPLDDGAGGTSCVQAEHTATFVALKQGFLAPDAGKFTGTVHVLPIGVPQRLIDDAFDG